MTNKEYQLALELYELKKAVLEICVPMLHRNMCQDDGPLSKYNFKKIADKIGYEELEKPQRT